METFPVDSEEGVMHLIKLLDISLVQKNNIKFDTFVIGLLVVHNDSLNQADSISNINHCTFAVSNI